MDELSLRISRPELSYHQKSFYELCVLQGRKCKISIPIERNLPDTTTTDYYKYDDEHTYDYYIMLESDPSRKMLELFGWSKESSDAKPIIAHCPFYRSRVASDPVLPTEDDPDKPSFSLGTLTSRKSSDGYPKKDIVPIRVSEGCKIVIKTYMSDNPSDFTNQSFTVEKVVNTEDNSYLSVNLVPERTTSVGVETKTEKGDSGSRFIMQDDD